MVRLLKLLWLLDSPRGYFGKPQGLWMGYSTSHLGMTDRDGTAQPEEAKAQGGSQ